MTLQSHASTAREVYEGKATLLLPQEGTGTVFYNPRMSLNRDLAVLFVSSYFPGWRKLSICDAMTGSGVRAARYALECLNIMNVVAADRESETVETARKTIRLNGLDGKISPITSDANVLLLNHLDARFDLVDLDPFGSPAPFFESALRAVVDGGILAATATDMGPLTGARLGACIRKYGVRPVRAEFEKEVAVRVLASCLATIAGRLELGIRIVFAHASDHYARIYAIILKGKKAANESMSMLGFLEYCPSCLTRTPTNSLESVRTSCGSCVARTKIGGPIWLGPLWDGPTVQTMIQRTPALLSSRLTEIQNILSCIEEEWNAPAYHFRTDVIAQKFGIKPPSIGKVLAVLRGNGYVATRTHFHPNGFRTNAPTKEIASLLRKSDEKT
jgi:tRNA (guanine26-N2/guanine27-N2)-dimethyltransferase